MKNNDIIVLPFLYNYKHYHANYKMPIEHINKWCDYYYYGEFKIERIKASYLYEDDFVFYLKNKKFN